MARATHRGKCLLGLMVQRVRVQDAEWWEQLRAHTTSHKEEAEGDTGDRSFAISKPPVTQGLPQGHTS